jgi:L-threonylcarbamoyladenylate synthase
LAVTGDLVAEAAEAALAGRLIVVPTDTVYGIGTRPDDPSATARVFEAKQRDRDLALPILVDSIEAAREVARFDDRAEALARSLWPGALTLVLPRSDAATTWDLGGDPRTVGVRMPAHRLVCEVLAATGPLAVTSANRSGEPPATTCDELHAAFGDLVDVYLCQADDLRGAASTVLVLTEGRARILRQGDVTREAIARCMPGGGALLDSRPSP